MSKNVNANTCRYNKAAIHSFEDNLTQKRIVINTVFGTLFLLKAKMIAMNEMGIMHVNWNLILSRYYTYTVQ